MRHRLKKLSRLSKMTEEEQPVTDVEAQDVETPEPIQFDDAADTITVEIELNEFENQKRLIMEQFDIDVSNEISHNIQSRVEDMIHQMFQQARD